MTPRVCVVIATRNRRALLARALASVAAQRFRDFETVVVDDGSVDGTPDWLRATHPGVTLVALDAPQGAAAARNLGVACARGDFVAFLDDDDAWRPAYLDSQVARLDADPRALLSTTGHVEVDAAGRVARPQRPPLFDYADPLVHLLAECPIHTLSTVACRRAAFARFGPLDETLAVVHDLDWYARVLADGGRWVHDPAVRVERGVPGGLVMRHREWHAEEQAVHRRAFASGRIGPRDRRRIGAARALLFARIGFGKGDRGFAVARLADALLASPSDSIRIAARRLLRRGPVDTWNGRAREAR